MYGRDMSRPGAAPVAPAKARFSRHLVRQARTVLNLRGDSSSQPVLPSLRSEQVRVSAGGRRGPFPDGFVIRKPGEPVTVIITVDQLRPISRVRRLVN